MRRRSSAAVALLVGAQIVGCTPTSPNDCGLKGEPAHPEIGGELVFTCYRASGGSGLFLLDVATGHVRALTSDGAWNTDPAWSPDGTRVSYVSTRDGQTDLYVMDLAGDGGVTRLTFGPGWNGNPTWSPDGRVIMFDSSRDGVNDSPHNNFRNLYVVRSDGTDLRRLTALAGYNGDPAWAPVAQRVAFVSDRDGAFNLFVMNPDGSEQRTLTHWQGSRAAAFYARWSPDGSRLVFEATEPGSDAMSTSLYWIDAQGGDPHRLTEGADDSQPDWSRDGTRIVFVRAGEIFVELADGTGTTPLTNDGSRKIWVRWRPK